jgi:chromosome partitioning protein
MVAIVAFASQKGGVGKSTLARALACEVAQDELRIRLADLDTMQHTTADWHTARLQAGLEPVGDVQVFATMQQALKNAESYDRTTGHLATETIAKVLYA